MPDCRRPKVVIADLDRPASGIEDRELAAVNAEVVHGQCKTEDEVIALCSDADGIIIQYAPVTRRVIGRLGRCRVISRYGIGVDTVDVAAATEHGIWVANAPGYCVTEVAEHTLALILACSRRLFLFDDAIRRGVWDTSGTAGRTQPLGEQTLGLIGFGDIGRAVAARARALGLHVLAYSPRTTAEIASQHGAERADLPDLLRQSDYVSLHCPLTAQTRHLIDATALKIMKPSAYLVNTSRGALVDQAALHNALIAGQIAGAALDVLEKEPPAPDDPLLRLRNVIFTPHAAWYSTRSMENLSALTARNVVAVLRDGRPLHSVNKPA